MITGIRFVTNGAGAQNRLRGKARRERIRKHLAEVEKEPPWARWTQHRKLQRSYRTGKQVVEADPEQGFERGR